MPTYRGLTAYADGAPGATGRLLWETTAGEPRGIAPADLPLFGDQINPSDQNITYSRAAHGDSPVFWYGVPLSAGRTLTFPAEQGVKGIAIVRVRLEAINELTVRLENEGSPGVYTDLPVPAGHTRILRKAEDSGPGNPSWWTDLGFFQNGAQVNHSFASQAEMEAGTVSQARSMSPQRVAQAIVALSAGGGLSEEQVDDRVNALLQAGANVSLSYNDAANTLTISSSAAGGAGAFPLLNLKTDFSATGDGVADDGPEFSAALTSIMGSGRTLFVPRGTYLCTTWTPIAHTGPVRIIMERGAVIRIAGTTAFFAGSPAVFHELNIEGGEIDMDAGGRIAEWRGHLGTGSVPLFRLQDVTIRNVINTAAPTGGTAMCFDAWDSSPTRVLFDNVQVHNCTFIGGTSVFELYGVSGGCFTNNHFRNQTYVGVALNRASMGAFGGRVLFSGNRFENITNSSTAADTHGLMIFGKGFVIEGNFFGYQQSAAANPNNEGLYTKGHDLIISNNIFEDAGGQRGFCVLKGQKFGDTAPSQAHPMGYSTIVTGNVFRCTPEFIASTGGKTSPPDPAAFHIEMVGVLAQGNYFYNFRKYRTATVGSETQIGGGLVALLDNHFLNCGYGADTQVCSLSVKGPEARIIYRGNVHTQGTSDGSAAAIAGRLLYIENADLATAIIEGNYFEDATTAAIWLRSSSTPHLAKAIVRDNTFLDCVDGLRVSGGTLPLLITRSNRNAATGALQHNIANTTTHIAESAS